MKQTVDYGELADSIENWIKLIVSEASATGVVVGLSGGLDSAVSAALCAEALGNENILGLMMPCGSIQSDTDDGVRIAEHLRIKYKVLDLSPVLQSFIEAGRLDDTSVMNLANIKSRLRMAMLYAYSPGRLVLGTSNYSEILVGYWTKWGDGASDFLPISRLYKDEVRELAATLGLPRWVINRIPSAGLWPGQSDEEEMEITYREIKAYFQNGDISVSAIARIDKMIESSEHKRNPTVYFDARKWMEEYG
ncbi:MAG: NAD(+) synthase [Candidatus Aegiribacteria sp.]|nr:NAD(+) synthase [Candidatus Aegiribacteria sp.]